MIVSAGHETGRRGLASTLIRNLNGTVPSLPW
jgi:hypothetical protein